MRTIFILIITLFSGLFSQVYAQKDSIPAEPKSLVNWITIQEAESLNMKQPKPFIIDFYTDWCGWCKHMMRTTFSDPGIAGYINANFYPVRFNAETKDTIVYRGEKYWNKSTGSRPPHELAIKLLQGKLTYPTLLFINNNYKFNLLVPGYQSPRDIEPFLVYTVEYIFNTTPIESFREAYKKLSEPDTLRKDTATIHWVDIKTLLNKKENPDKKMLILVSTAWCNSGKVYKDVVFKDSTVVKEANKYFLPVYFDAEIKDTLIFNGTTYINDGKHGTLHNLAIALGNARFALPLLVIADNNFNLITSIPQYYPQHDLALILKFFGQDIYKTKSWEDFIKSADGGK